MEEMLNLFLQKKGKDKQYRASYSYKLIFKPNMFESIMKLKSWKNNADVAKEMLFTRQYISMIRRGVCSISTDFILRLLELTGSVESENWSTLFQIIPTGKFDPNHQFFNHAKHNGKMPYVKHSPSAMLRKKDCKIEEQEN